ncbi:MAG: LysR family transcriptional regulator [Proteobacteria bacterium]|nr:LysR family transcriptional regulator [Pseudomonadota bacterium]
MTEVTQPTLTRQMQALEQQLGFPLLVRHMDEDVTLTRKGEEFLRILERVFVDMKAFADKVEGNKEHPRKIVIAASTALATYEIGDFILDYNDEHPHLKFDLIGKDQALDVILYDFDIAIRPYDADAKDVCQEPLFTLEKKLYASKEYLEKYGAPKTVEDLKDHPLIARSILHAKEECFSDANWLLKLGRLPGKAQTSCLGASSLEREIDAAKKGKGIIAAYKELSIVRESGLINILPDVRQETPYFFVCPDYLKEDREILEIKNYLQDRMALLCQEMKQVA